ncbi:MAG: hypothetical protein DRI61_06595 [Chloroflexi bacterium]|nr:MAG: hypothetical protein DRI61_06595 [Chloroflexota bacterium]
MKKHNTVVGDKVLTGKARLSYPSLFKPDTGGQYSDDKYKATFLLNKKESAAELKVLQSAVLKVAKEAFGVTTKLSEIAHPFRKGEEKADENGDIPDGYDGVVYFTAKSKYRPDVVDQAVKPAEEAEVYGGCFVRASVYPYSYVAGKDKGVTFRLGNVQKMDDGEPFGSTGSKASEDFESVDTPNVEANEEEPFEDDDDDIL